MNTQNGTTQHNDFNYNKHTDSQVPSTTVTRNNQYGADHKASIVLTASGRHTTNLPLKHTTI